MTAISANSARPGTGPVVLWGGTFDPVHFGHLRLALELREQLCASELRLLPAAQPPLRDAPFVSAEHRVAMLQLAVADSPLLVDQRELRRAGPSYTVDTLAEVRSELGPDQPLVFCMGVDAFAALERWHRWQQLFELAHIVVTSRPGHKLAFGAALQQQFQQREELNPLALEQRPAGAICCMQLTELAISSTAIRALLMAGKSPQFLLPQTVWHYIQQHQLYQNIGPTEAV